MHPFSQSQIANARYFNVNSIDAEQVERNWEVTVSVDVIKASRFLNEETDGSESRLSLTETMSPSRWFLSITLLGKKDTLEHQNYPTTCPVVLCYAVVSSWSCGMSTVVDYHE